MIRLIREDGIEILLNTETIQQVGLAEERGAIITLKTGEILKVKNPVYDIVQKTKAYIQGIKEERREYDKKMGEEPASKEKPEKERSDKERPDRDRQDRGRYDRDRPDRGRNDRSRNDRGRNDRDRNDRGRYDRDRRDSNRPAREGSDRYRADRAPRRKPGSEGSS